MKHPRLHDKGLSPVSGEATGAYFETTFSKKIHYDNDIQENSILFLIVTH